MSNPDPDLLREMLRSVDLTGAAGLGNSPVPPRRGKVFKSGNSRAVRMPGGLGLEAGMGLELTNEPDGICIQQRADAPKRRIDAGKFAGKAPWLTTLAPEGREWDHRTLDWLLLDNRA